MNPHALVLALDAATAVCVALLGVRMLISAPRRANAQLVALICACVVIHIALARYEYGGWIPPEFRLDLRSLHPLLDVVRNLSPGLFMILVHRAFADRGKLPAWLYAAFVLQTFLEGPVKWFGFTEARLATEVAPTALQALFVSLALYWTLADWRADLVEARRRGRVILIVMLAINVIASSVLLRLVIPQETFANYQTHVALTVIDLLLFGFLLAVSGPGESFLLEPERRKPQRPGAATDQSDLGLIVHLIEQEQLYLEPGLTLRALADRAGLPEYKVRRLIHEGLGHRNFNAFLHAYRVQEACRQLKDPALRRTPILTIALSVGYQSLNTFNRGFREVTGVTPSAYRADADPRQILQSDPVS